MLNIRLGSGTSSTQAFLNAVDPSIAIFQVGHRNRYWHPKAEVYERYGAMGIMRLRTDVEGAVLMELGERMLIDQYRGSHRRYWYGK